jgi:L-ascorbate metabolism protein UlaG (beta-lactamase superfamily)
MATAQCTVSWWGHASVEICLDGRRLVTDPLLRRRIGPLSSVGYRPPVSELATVDAVLLSHLHRDHTDLPSVRLFPRRTKAIVPVGAAELVHEATNGVVEELAEGASAPVGDVLVQATHAVHDGRRHVGSVTAEAVGYVLQGSRSVYFAGDTAVFDDMVGLARGLPHGLDVALLPVSGWGLTLGDGHMDAEEAAHAVALLRPRIAVPIHWGTLRIPVLWRLRPRYSTEAAQRFAMLVVQQVPDTTVVVPEPGQAIVIPVGGDS